LSNGSVGIYGSIIDNLGRSIEAVDPKALVPDCTIQNPNPSTTVRLCPVRINADVPGELIADGEMTVAELVSAG
jgi:hypothetical protein